jgi:hypothetical protein
MLIKACRAVNTESCRLMCKQRGRQHKASLVHEAWMRARAAVVTSLTGMSPLAPSRSSAWGHEWLEGLALLAELCGDPELEVLAGWLAGWLEGAPGRTLFEPSLSWADG